MGTYFVKLRLQLLRCVQWQARRFGYALIPHRNDERKCWIRFSDGESWEIDLNEAAGRGLYTIYRSIHSQQ